MSAPFPNNDLQLIERVTLAAYLADGTVVYATLDGESSSGVAATGPSGHRAHDVLGGIAEAMNHDELFFDADAMHNLVLSEMPWAQDDEYIPFGTLALVLGFHSTQWGWLREELLAMERAGEAKLVHGRGWGRL